MPNRTTAGPYQPSPPFNRNMRTYGGGRNGGRSNHQRAAVAVAASAGVGRIKGNVMASGGLPAAGNDPFGGGTARGAMSITPSFTGTGD